MLLKRNDSIKTYPIVCVHGELFSTSSYTHEVVEIQKENTARKDTQFLVGLNHHFARVTCIHCNWTFSRNLEINIFDCPFRSDQGTEFRINVVYIKYYELKSSHLWWVTNASFRFNLYFDRTTRHSHGKKPFLCMKYLNFIWTSTYKRCSKSDIPSSVVVAACMFAFLASFSFQNDRGVNKKKYSSDWSVKNIKEY